MTRTELHNYLDDILNAHGWDCSVLTEPDNAEVVAIVLGEPEIVEQIIEELSDSSLITNGRQLDG